MEFFTFAWITDPQIWLSLLTLSALEIVLGIDNLVFIAILTGRLPEHQRALGRKVGLSLALITRLILLATLAWIVGLTYPVFSLAGNDFSWRDIILIAGGLFLLYKATVEIHEMVEKSEEEPDSPHGAAGVTFRYGVSITGIEAEAGRVVAVHTSAGRETADAYIGAMGSYTPELVKPLGIALPVYPIKGYSLTVPITNAAVAPVSTVMDETYKVATTRFDNRIRVGGTAEIAGWDTTLRPHRRGPLERSLRDLFPEAGDVSKATFWCGLRPMTPDGTPVIGRTRLANFYLNTGHGTLGWTMAAASGQLIADIVSGRSPEIDVTDLDLSRY